MRVYRLATIIACVFLYMMFQCDSVAGDLKPLPLPPAASARIENLAANSDLLLLGEIHGTQEVPELVASLLEPLTKLGYHTLALEVPNNAQNSLLRWLLGETERIPDFFAHPNGDGRGNAQLLTLARIAASPPFQWRIICFDESEFVPASKRQSGSQNKQTGKVAAPTFTDDDMVAQWCERDATMASNMLREAKSLTPTNKIVAICGNLHARTTNDMKQPMVSKLWPSLAGVLRLRLPACRVNSVNIEFYSGSYFNNGKVQTLANRPLVEPVVRPAGQSGWDLVLSLPVATPATFLGPERMPAAKAASSNPGNANQR